MPVFGPEAAVDSETTTDEAVTNEGASSQPDLPTAARRLRLVVLIAGAPVVGGFVLIRRVIHKHSLDT